MSTWETGLYEAKKSFFQKSRISSSHIQLKKALEMVEKQIKPLSRELDEKKKENDRLKAVFADATTQLRLADHQKEKERTSVKKEYAVKVLSLLKEKQLLYDAQTMEYEERIKTLTAALQAAQNLSEKLRLQKSEIEFSASENLRSIFENERLENRLTLKRKDEDINLLNERMMQKERELTQLTDTIKQAEESRMKSQKQWLEEITFSRKLLTKTVEEMDTIQQDYVKNESALIKDFQEQIIQSRKHIAYIEKELPEQRFKLIQDELKEKNDLLSAQTQEITDLRSSLDKSKNIYAVQQDLETLTNDYKLLQKSKAGLEEEHTLLEQEAEKLRDQVSRFESEVEELRDRPSASDMHPAGVPQEEFDALHNAFDTFKTDQEELVSSYKVEKEALLKKTRDNDTVITSQKKTIHTLEESVLKARRGLEDSLPETPHTHFNFIPQLPKQVVPEPHEHHDEPAEKISLFKRLRSSKRFAFAAGAVLIMIAGGFVTYKSVAPRSAQDHIKTIDPSFTSPASNPSALIWDGLTFWSTDWFSKKIFKHKPRSLHETTRAIKLTNIIPTSLTWGEGSLWICDAWAGKIYRLDPDNNFAVQAVYASPGRSPSGLTWDGRNLWSCDADEQMIYHHDTDNDLRIIAAYPSPRTSPSGLLWDGETMWSSDKDAGVIYRHRIDDQLSVVAQYQPPDYQDGKDTLIGLTWDGKNFFTVGERSGRFYKHALKDMIKK